MTDYEYILQQARKFHYSKWDDEELRKCVDMLQNLSRQELTSLTLSRWTKEAKILRENIFNILYKDQIGKREERIKGLDIDALIEEFKDKKSGNVALIRKEMQNRYLEDKDCDKIAEAFNASSERDKQWVNNPGKEENKRERGQESDVIHQLVISIELSTE